MINLGFFDWFPVNKGVDDLTDQPIHDEVVSYKILLYRKDKVQRLAEVVVFLAGFFAMIPFFQLRSASFVLTLLVWGALVMAAVPAVYLGIFRLRYTLYPNALTIRSRGKEETFDLAEVKRAYDLPYIYEIRGKKRPLLVDDDFLESLDAQLERIKRRLD
ncbi:hypothetical protein [Salinithrix halophila]|uniref:Uncharacterized protein n=1 Tax=Salinithrix halophila TaxID=1485204 RepID=A0ABV8J8Y1_9BACL